MFEAVKPRSYKLFCHLWGLQQGWKSYLDGETSFWMMFQGFQENLPAGPHHQARGQLPTFFLPGLQEGGSVRQGLLEGVSGIILKVWRSHRRAKENILPANLFIKASARTKIITSTQNHKLPFLPLQSKKDYGLKQTLNSQATKQYLNTYQRTSLPIQLLPKQKYNTLNPKKNSYSSKTKQKTINKPQNVHRNQKQNKNTKKKNCLKNKNQKNVFPALQASPSNTFIVSAIALSSSLRVFTWWSKRRGVAFWDQKDSKYLQKIRKNEEK